MTYLLDINVLIALIDPAHMNHNAAHAWFEAKGSASWATCPITENGVLRILGHPRYPNAVASPAEVAPILASLRGLPGHQFWPDDIALTGNDMVDPAQIRTPNQVTETYLLALAAAHKGQLATFDRRLVTRPVRRGNAALHIMDGL